MMNSDDDKMCIFRGDSDGYGVSWYTFDLESLSLVAQIRNEKSGYWTVMGDEIFWTGGLVALPDPEVYEKRSRNLLKHNSNWFVTIWEHLSEELVFPRICPSLVTFNNKLYVFNGNGGDPEKKLAWAEVFNLDSKEWELIADTTDHYEFGSKNAVIVEDEGVPSVVIFYSFSWGCMLFYTLKEGTFHYEEHESLDLYSRIPPDFEGDNEHLSILREVCVTIRPALAGSTLYWFTYDLYLCGYDFVSKMWVRSSRKIGVMEPLQRFYSLSWPVLVHLGNDKFNVIHHQLDGILVIACFTVSRRDSSLIVSVKSRHTSNDLPAKFILRDAMAIFKFPWNRFEEIGRTKIPVKITNAVELSSEENVYMAKLAEQAGRYEEMVEFMEKVAKRVDVQELTVEERDLLSVAYKNVTDARRDSWRTISLIKQKEEGHGNEDHVSSIKEYRGKIEADLGKICDGILSTLESHLIPTASTAESKVFYLKMKGDYARYLAEFKTGAEREKAVDNTILAYTSAQDIALVELASTHPIRLGLALNLAVFYYEILNSPHHACNLAKQAFDDATAERHTLAVEDYYVDSTLIMQLLQDKLTLWSSDTTDDAGG